MRRHALRLLPLALVLGACEALTGSDGPDRDPPVVTVSGFRSGDTVHTPTVDVEGSAEDRRGDVSRLTFALNGAAETEVQVPEPGERVDFHLLELPLREGDNRLVVSAVDEAGNRGSLELSLVLAYRDSVSTVRFEPDSVRLAWGTETRLRPVVRNPSDRALDFRGPTVWASSDTGVAAVSDSGVVTARRPGRATITATLAGKVAEARLTVPFPYTLAALEAPAGTAAYGWAINEAGQVAGEVNSSAGQTQAVLWTGAAAAVLGEGAALDVNARGEVVGWAPVPVTDLDGFEQRPETAVRWQGGTRTVLLAPQVDVLGAWSSRGSAVNDAGDVAITWRSSNPGRGGRWHGKVFLYRGGAAREILDATSAEATEINESGWISGTTGSYALGDQRAFVWRDGELTYVAEPLSTGQGVSDAGEVVGGAYRAFRWRDGTLTTSPIAEQVSHEAEAVNGRGDVVGWMGGYRGSDGSRAFLWRRGGAPTDLNLLVDAPEWVFVHATDVNERGQIVGHGRNVATGAVRALVATPVQ